MTGKTMKNSAILSVGRFTYLNHRSAFFLYDMMKLYRFSIIAYGGSPRFHALQIRASVCVFAIEINVVTLVHPSAYITLFAIDAYFSLKMNDCEQLVRGRSHGGAETTVLTRAHQSSLL